jgi:hypothetical protein
MLFVNENKILFIRNIYSVSGKSSEDKLYFVFRGAEILWNRKKRFSFKKIFVLLRFLKQNKKSNPKLGIWIYENISCKFLETKYALIVTKKRR